MNRNWFWLLRLPAFGYMLLFMAAPMLLAVAYSFMTSGAFGKVELPFTTDAYSQLLYQQDFDGTYYFSGGYLYIFLRSILYAVATVAICVVVSVPLAWTICEYAPRTQQKLVMLIALPFWINTLIKIYCWVLILRDEGLLNSLLQTLGITSAPISFLYNDGAIILGMVYLFLPFMVLPIFAIFGRINGEIIEASADLYANRWMTFRRIILPLSMPGVAAGSLLVFPAALGQFLAPDLLGGGQKLMIGSLIQIQFSVSRNWPLGAALSTVLSVIVMLLLIRVVRDNLQQSERA